MIPATGLAGRAQSVFVEASLIFTGSAAVTLGNVGADRADGAVQLAGQADSTLVLCQLGYIRSRQVTGKDGEPVNFHPPKRVIGEFWSDRS